MLQSWDVSSYFRRVLSVDECAVVLDGRHDPQLIRGPRTIRTYGRWRRVTIVALRPFTVAVLDDDVPTRDGVAITASGSAEAQVVDPVAAATRVVDYEKATRLVLHTAIRGVVKERPVSEVPGNESELESAVEQLVSHTVGDWGIVLSSLALRLTSNER
jgi:regulator of protease activity HflC (stomatin/prohibitin superfamily)